MRKLSLAQPIEPRPRRTGPERASLAWLACAAVGTLIGAATATASAAQPQVGTATASGLAPRSAAHPRMPAPSDAARAWARRVIDSNDHAGLPFVVVDKLAAQVVLHHADGSVAATSAALLGRQRGDHSVPGVGLRTQAGTLLPQDMTTPAGRFVARPGHNHTGEAVLWLDERDALALHRLRPGAMHAVRARALAGTAPGSRRLSAGCVVVPAAFFDGVVTPLLGRRGGIVYVLPEHSAWQQLWLAMQTTP